MVEDDGAEEEEVTLAAEARATDADDVDDADADEAVAVVLVLGDSEGGTEVRTDLRLAPVEADEDEDTWVTFNFFDSITMLPPFSRTSFDSPLADALRDTLSLDTTVKTRSLR